MKLIKVEFVKNANKCGKNIFTRIKHDTNPAGQPVYIYKRTSIDKRILGFEVFVPTIKKAGTYNLPPKGSGKTITYEEDFEVYPGAKSSFSHSAFFCANMERATIRFNDFMKGEVVVLDDDDDEEVIDAVTVEPDATEPGTRKGRGRPRRERTELIIPDKEFSVKELAELNKVDYSIAFIFIKEHPKQIEFVRSEHRATRGKPTNLYKKSS